LFFNVIRWKLVDMWQKNYKKRQQKRMFCII